MHENAYLRDSWNWIDILVVITGLLELLNLNGANLKSLRALRVLRPLRSIKAFPSMRKLIQGMINSLPSLINAVIFMGFIFVNFAIFGTQQFGGLYYSRCRLTPEPVNDTWPYDPLDQRLCSASVDTGRQCPENQYCGSWKDDLSNMREIDYGFTNFNNLLESLFTIYQCITLEGWTKIMYNLMDTEQPNWLVVLFFVLLVIICSLFMLNVVLAIFGDSLDRSESIQ